MNDQKTSVLYCPPSPLWGTYASPISFLKPRKALLGRRGEQHYLEHDARRLVEVHHLADDRLEKVLVTWERAKGGQPGTPRGWGDREQKEKGG